MSTHPLIVAADLTGHRALVVGAGPVGLRKLARLLSAGASVRVVSPDGTLPDDDRVEHRQRPFEEADLDGCALVFACTDDPLTNTRIARLAAGRGLWCNAASRPSDGNLRVLATTRVGPLQIAVGSDGAAPGVSRALREHLALTLGPEWAQLTELARTLRGALRDHTPDTQARTHRLRAWLSEPLLRWLATDDRDALARATLDHLDLSLPAPASPLGRPTVILSGFGPFPGVDHNPSPDVAHAAAERLLDRFPDVDVRVVELPTHFDAGWEALRDVIDPLYDDPGVHLAAILPLGVAGGASAVRLERTAINHRRGGVTDASGRLTQTHGEPLDPWGPDGLFARLDVDRVVAKLVGAGHRIEVSESAGTYVCNEVFYKLIAHCRRAGIDARAGFIHIPPVPEAMGLDAAAEIVARIAEDALRRAR